MRSNQQRSVRQSVALIGALGAILFAACPALGVPIMITAFLMQRHYTKGRKAQAIVQYHRALERQDRVRILALKSLR
jgi:hypothetical protein